MPSLEPLCEGCLYVPTFDALYEAVERFGGRDEFIVVGDPGCMVRAQAMSYKLLDVKNSLGSSIGVAAGIALSQGRGGHARGGADGSGKRVVAICGDSSFLHSDFGGFQHVRAGLMSTGKRDLVDSRVLDQRLPGFGAGSMDHVDHAGRKANFLG